MSGTQHLIRWWAYLEPGKLETRIRRTRTMRGQWAYDATCSCGWDSKIGGGTERAVRRAIEDHKLEASYGQDRDATGRNERAEELAGFRLPGTAGGTCHVD